MSPCIFAAYGQREDEQVIYTHVVNRGVVAEGFGACWTMAREVGSQPIL